MSCRWPLLLSLSGSMACGKAATHRLGTPTGNPDLSVGELALVTAADVNHVPAIGWDLSVQLDADWRGQDRARIDLTRAVVKVDSLPWENCRAPDDVDRDALIVVLEPGDRITRTLRCKDIPQPHEQLLVRFHASGTGAPGGYIELEYRGLD